MTEKIHDLKTMLDELRIKQAVSFDDCSALFKEVADKSGMTPPPFELSGNQWCALVNLAVARFTTPPAAPVPQPFPQEAAAFKAWFDAWWLGDGEQGEVIPGQSDPHFLTYMDQYTLGFGAWMAAKHAVAQPMPAIVDQHPLSQYINAAGINANDSPHVVVSKLERSMLTSATSVQHLPSDDTEGGAA